MQKSMFKKIMVPLDGSKYSRKALLHAIEIAKKFKSSIYLVTVVDTTDFPPGMLLSLLKKDTRLEKSIGEFIVAAKSIARKELLANAAICKEKGVDAYYEIIAGKTVESILKFERGRKIDLIVVGSHGLQGIKRIKSLGSVSRKLSEMASCPTMIVH